MVTPSSNWRRIWNVEFYPTTPQSWTELHFEGLIFILCLKEQQVPKDNVNRATELAVNPCAHHVDRLFADF